MFPWKRAHTVKKAKVQDAESASIHERRKNLGVDNHDDFQLLAEQIDIPSEQRSGALRGLLAKLNDSNQRLLWRQHAERHPERHGIANFVGLALSGGGIRSATFNLGVLQVLAWTRLLKFVDYLSTVSGGGYIGSCVSSMLASPLKAFPFEHKQGQKEGPIFRHLRNNAEYLAPHGIIDYLVIPMTVLRGMTVNLLVILPYLFMAAMATALLHPTVDSLRGHMLTRSTQQMHGLFGDSFVITKLLLAVLLLSFVLYPIVHMFAQRANHRSGLQWKWRTFVGHCYGVLLLVTFIFAFIEFQPVVLHWLIVQHRTHGLNVAMLSGGLTAVQALFPAALSVWLMKNAEKLLAKYALALLGISALAVFWGIYLGACVFLIDGGHAVSLSAMAIPAAITAALLVYGLLFVDVNYTSVHAFYRDRLSKAYIVRQAGASDDLQPNDTQRLSHLNTAWGPYHLINAAINLRSTQEEYRRGRHAESFIFSKHYVGCEPTGYCKTKSMESQSRHLNLATAMAISGAAAAPNMGKQTNRLLVFFLSMLNVRLDYWLPNPRYAIERENEHMPRSPLRRVGPLYLMRELFGRLTDSSRNVNLSDGGHYDNMGLYELFRRECRLIICGDGEADPHLQFNGLSEALRMAQIDFGIIVEMQGLDALRAGEQNYAIGRIRYSGEREGWLLYLKQSLRGDDTLLATLTEAQYQSSSKRNDSRQYDAGAYIAEYKSRNPDFPHQSTGDQFFDEAQFECTRAVGYNVAYRTLCN